jgi:large subunit ribosomal protein L32
MPQLFEHHLRAVFAPRLDFWEPRLELAGLGLASDEERPAVSALFPRVQELLEGSWLMGVPKSKVSPSRKRMKHLQHVPEPVNWYKCDRCGEPKRPHRICTANFDICALSEEDYALRVPGVKKDSKPASAST